MLEEKDAPLQSMSADSSADALPEDDAIMEKWAVLPTLYATKQRLANALRTAKVGISAEDGRKVLTFSVINDVQQKWIEQNLLSGLEDNMMKLLGSRKFRLKVDVLPDDGEQKKTAFRAEDKAKELLESNPNLRSLVTDLSLDVK